MTNLKTYINSITHLPEVEWALLEGIAEIKYLKKNELIVQKGQRGNAEVFVEKGVVRGFIIDEEGNEKNTAFFQESEFMSTLMFRTEDGYSIYNYQALCPTIIISFNSKKLPGK